MRLRLNPFSAKTSRKSRRARKPNARRRMLILALGLLAAGSAVTGGWHLSANGWPERAWAEAGERALRGSAQAGLAIAEVVVEGRVNAQRDELLAALDVRRGMPILALDPETARLRLEALGWVRHATVARRLPDTVFVRIEERQPLALWQRDGKLHLVDREGAVIRGQDVAPFARLPLIVGADAPQHAAALLDLLANFPEIAEHTDAAIRVSQRRWNLRLANGIDISLPETGVAAALGRLADLHARKDVLDRDIIAVDLRKPDRLIVRIHPEARERVGLDGKNT